MNRLMTFFGKLMGKDHSDKEAQAQAEQIDKIIEPSLKAFYSELNSENPDETKLYLLYTKVMMHIDKSSKCGSVKAKLRSDYNKFTETKLAALANVAS